MDGSWQLGHVPADEYGRRAQQAAMQMKAVDPTIETVVCGTSDPSQDSYGRWDRTALEAVGGLADYLSVHRYVGNHNGDVEDYLAVGASIDRFVEDAASVCRHVAAVTGRRRPVRLCVDEWNVWYRGTELDGRWTTAPHLIEEQYDLSDALVVAQFLNSFVRRADVVAVANLAQMVNVIAPLVTRGDELLVQSTFHAFRMAATRLRGTSLRVGQTGPEVQSRSYGAAPLVDASVVVDGRRLQTVLVNRSTTVAAPATLTMPGASFGSELDAEILTGPDATTMNTWERPDAVVPAPFDGVKVVHGDTLVLDLPPLAVVAVGATLG
jgi:alpha-N-arabinofuranosidase